MMNFVSDSGGISYLVKVTLHSIDYMIVLFTLGTMGTCPPNFWITNFVSIIKSMISLKKC